VRDELKHAFSCIVVLLYIAAIGPTALIVAESSSLKGLFTTDVSKNSRSALELLLFVCYLGYNKPTIRILGELL